MSIRETQKNQWQEQVKWIAGGLYVLPNPTHSAGPTSERFLRVRGRLYHHYGVLSSPERHDEDDLRQSCWAMVALSKSLYSTWPHPSVRRIFNQIISAAYQLEEQLGEEKNEHPRLRR